MLCPYKYTLIPTVIPVLQSTALQIVVSFPVYSLTRKSNCSMPLHHLTRSITILRNSLRIELHTLLCSCKTRLVRDSRVHEFEYPSPYKHAIGQNLPLTNRFSLETMDSGLSQGLCHCKRNICMHYIR